MVKEKDDVVVPSRPKLKFRYFCPNCTGRAMYAAEKREFTTITCQNCHLPVKYDANNWFEIDNAKELAEVNA